MSGPVWRCGEFELDCGARTHVMGVVNVTPDSFSDGGRFLDPDVAIEHGVRLVEEGADLLDVGGESTRPGSDPVPSEEEWARVVPVIHRLAEEVEVPISVDTRKAEVARAAIESGASLVNDVTAGRDPEMFQVVAEAGAGMVLMHIQGDPKTMQEEPTYDDVVREVRDHLAERLEAAAEAGIEPDQLCVDPGLGFGKTGTHSMTLMREIAVLLELGRPVLVGPSRKSFIGAALDDAPAEERLEGTLGAVALLVSRGAHVVRVHDVRETARAVRVVDAILRS